ncbi:MAG: histidine kinase [Clostridium sp.]|nr:histidine kinase [Clostridium sp.]
MILEKLTTRNSKFNYIKYLFVMLFIAVSIFGYLICHSSQALSYNTAVNSSVKPLTIEGMYKWNRSDEWIPFDNYSDISINDTQLIIKGKINQDIHSDNDLFLYLDKISVKVFVNRKMIYSDDDQVNTRWGIIDTSGINKGDEIKIIMKNNKKMIYNTEFNEFLKRLCYGSHYDFLQKQIKNNFGRIVLCIVIFVIGIAAFFLVIVLHTLDIPTLEGHGACALLLITGASCTFINYDYITLIFTNAFMVNIVDFVLGMLIIEFLMIYLSTYVKTKEYKIVVNSIIILWTLIIVLYMILRVFNIVCEVELGNKAAPFVIILIVVEGYYMINDYNHNKNESTKYVFYSGIILAIFTIMEIVYFYITHTFLIFLFQMGLLIYTFIQVCILIKSSKENIIQAARVKEIEKEMIQNRVEIMLSQIKPHFLYNTLATIKALCLKDVNLARTAIDYFSKYLRANMNSLSEKGCIPFSRELSHVKSYLYIEKLRFAERLNIEFEIETESFMCPPLLLQTMVENAVKHGICNKTEGGTVLIKTYETEENYIINIIDDGIGFDMDSNTDDGERAHIGIENTRQRLKEMCCGNLKIESSLGSGTTVTLEIPKGVNCYESNRSR